MDELATVPALAEYGQGFCRCAVHQQTQRTYALASGRGVGSNAVTILDSHLQVVATVEAAETNGEDPIRDIAVHGDEVLVLTGECHREGPGLRLLDLDGRFLCTIAARHLRNPRAVAASHGRAYVVDEDGYEEDKEDEEEEEDPIRHVLLVIDIHSGDILQQVRVDWVDEIGAVLVDGDEIYIAGFGASEVVALPFAGSEA